jgi:hypothetical protein
MGVIAGRFLLLCVGHALADFPLQGDFLAKGKNHRNPIPGVPWYQCLLAHSLIHAGIVYAITGSWKLGVAEWFAHVIIDFLKSEGKLTFNQDQVAHYVWKLTWAVLA